MQRVGDGFWHIHFNKDATVKQSFHARARADAHFAPDRADFAQTAAIRAARRVTQLREQRTALEAERAALEREIRLRTGRKELGRVAEDELGLHFPNDSEFTQLRVTRPLR